MTALTRLLDGKAIEAQGYRSCMNILELGKRASGNRVLLRAACRELVDDDPQRLITYTAVQSTASSALRAEAANAHHHRQQPRKRRRDHGQCRSRRDRRP